MKLPRFGVEEWLNVHENSAIYDIAGVSISSFTLEELFALSGTNPEDFIKIAGHQAQLWMDRRFTSI